MIVKGNDLDILKQKSTLRVVIWPRKAHLGSKDDNQQITFQLAICELSGHIVIKGKLITNIRKLNQFLSFY